MSYFQIQYAAPGNSYITEIIETSDTACATFQADVSDTHCTLSSDSRVI